MQITDSIIKDSITKRPFGSFEPFISGKDKDARLFYSKVLSALEMVPGVSVIREVDHHGSGYASYVSAFLFPSDGSTRCDHPDFVETSGILLYLSRLAPIAVYGASGRAENKEGGGSSSGFLGAENIGLLPDGDWRFFVESVADCLAKFRIEVLPREPLLEPAPDGIAIPTIFDSPYYIFDTLFYWMD